jgi:MFS family permease
LVKSHAEESLGANPGDAALNPADSVAMGVPAAKSPERPDPTRPGLLAALQHRAFRLLFCAFLVNQTGFWVSHISLQGLMVELTNNDTRQNGYLFFFLFIPAFLLAPIAGVIADRFDRKAIVLSCYLAVAAACGVLTFVTSTGIVTPVMLHVIAFAMGVSFAFSGPASMAIAANTVPQRDLASAVSLQSAANNLTRVAGPLLAAPLVASSRFDASFAIYLVAAITAAGLTFVIRIERYVGDPEDGGILARMASGFHHARERTPAVPALSVVAMLSAFGVSHTVLVPAFAQDVLGDPAWLAWLAASTGLGAMAGALMTGRSKHPPSLQRASLAMVLYGIAMGVFGLAKTPALALAAQLFVGYFYFFVMTTLQTLIQQIVDEAKRGRVMSLFQVCWAGLVPFGSLAMGLAAEPFGTPATILASAAICTLYGLGMCLRRERLAVHS